MYELRSPAPARAPFIENYWFVHGPGPVDLRVNVFVDARADLVFNFGAPYLRETFGGRSRRVGRSNLDAQRLEPIRIIQRGRVRATGVRFRLGGLAPFARKPLRTMTGRTVPPPAVFGPAARALDAALRDTADLDGQARVLDGFFLGLLTEEPDLGAFRRALDAAVASGGATRLDELARAAGASPRQVERLFARHLGIPPKALGRVLRFQTALRALMRDPGCTLGKVARGYKGYFPPQGPNDFAPNVVAFIQDRDRGVD